jgi:Tfp pilus assembly protein PilN
MANVNLISARRAERVRLTRITRALMLAAAGTGAISFLLIGVMSTRLLAAQSSVRTADSALTKLRPVLLQIETDERERNQLAPKLTTLTQAQQVTQHWFGIMDSLKRAVPEQTWLTSVSVEKSGDSQQTMKIDGVTANQSRVGETMYRLSLQPDFYKKVDLRFTQTAKTESGDNVDFELAAQLNQPEPAQKAGDAHAVKTN